MSATPRFWPASRAAARRRVSRRGFFFVAGAHLAAVAGVILLSAGPAKISVAAGRRASPADEAPSLTAEEAKAVVWMDPATFEAPSPDPAPPPAPEEITAPPEPPPRPAPVRVPAREPFLVPTPRPSPVRPKLAVAAKLPKKTSTPPPPVGRSRPTERPAAIRPRFKPFLPMQNPSVRNEANRHGSDPGADAGHADDGDAPAGAGGTDWYASMLHERFHARWEQPTSPFTTAQRYVATLRLRIERDGRISDYRLVRSSGLVPMDESVLAAAARVGRVDPPPAGLLRGGAYVVNVGFVRE